MAFGCPMEAIAQLELAYFLFKAGVSDFHGCVEWAIERLTRDEESGDSDVVRLAAATQREEVLALVEKVIERYVDPAACDDQLVAGKYVAALHEKYLGQSVSVTSLDAIFTMLSIYLVYPDWLVILSRNCEYATDRAYFSVPFEREFAYVAGLWASVTSHSEFEGKYRRAVSEQKTGLGDIACVAVSHPAREWVEPLLRSGNDRS